MRGYGRPDEYNSKTVGAELYVNERVLNADITRDDNGDIVTAGESVTFTAKAVGDWGEELTYKWYDKDGNALEDGETYVGTDTDTLTVKTNISLNEMGYYCVISGAYGSASTEVLVLNVKEADVPEETQKPEETEKPGSDQDKNHKPNPSQKDTRVPKTGDTAPLKTAVVMLLISAMAVIGVFAAKLRNKKRERM